MNGFGQIVEMSRLGDTPQLFASPSAARPMCLLPTDCCCCLLLGCLLLVASVAYCLCTCLLIVACCLLTCCLLLLLLLPVARMYVCGHVAACLLDQCLYAYCLYAVAYWLLLLCLAEVWLHRRLRYEVASVLDKAWICIVDRHSLFEINLKSTSLHIAVLLLHIVCIAVVSCCSLLLVCL